MFTPILCLHREIKTDSHRRLMDIDSEHTLGVLKKLISIDSINPAFDGGASDERVIAAFVAAELEDLGLEVFTHEPRPGRASVVGRLRGNGSAPSIMLYAHHDTVGVEGMTDPFTPREENGRIHGRGSYDMKGGLAACLGAVRALMASGTRPGGDLLVASVADEEEASLGMEEVLRHHHPDAAIVTEPTEMRICTAHKGFTWLEVEARGRAAHGSRPHLGVDANLQMAQLIAALAPLEKRLRETSPHPLLGVPSMHVGVLRGGSGPSIYAADCRALVERRTLPGERPDEVVVEMEEIVRQVATDRGIEASTRTVLSRGPFEATADSGIRRVVEEAGRDLLPHSNERTGVSFWTDAALLADAGVDTVLLGPIGAGAHAADEWVDAESVVTLAAVLARATRDYCRWG